MFLQVAGFVVQSLLGRPILCFSQGKGQLKGALHVGMVMQAQDAHLCSAVLALVHLLLDSDLTATQIFQALTRGSKQSACLTEAGVPLICLFICQLPIGHASCHLPFGADILIAASRMDCS